MNKPTKFSIQLQFQQDAHLDHERLVAKVTSDAQAAGGRVIATRLRQEHGAYFADVRLESQEPYHFWRALKRRLRFKQMPRMIIVCEGTDGWNDYRLLHHFSSAEKLDDLMPEALPTT